MLPRLGKRGIGDDVILRRPLVIPYIRKQKRSLNPVQRGVFVSASAT